MVALVVWLGKSVISEQLYLVHMVSTVAQYTEDDNFVALIERHNLQYCWTPYCSRESSCARTQDERGTLSEGSLSREPTTIGYDRGTGSDPVPLSYPILREPAKDAKPVYPIPLALPLLNVLTFCTTGLPSFLCPH